MNLSKKYNSTKAKKALVRLIDSAIKIKKEKSWSPDEIKMIEDSAK